MYNLNIVFKVKSQLNIAYWDYEIWYNNIPIWKGLDMVMNVRFLFLSIFSIIIVRK